MIQAIIIIQEQFMLISAIKRNKYLFSLGLLCKGFKANRIKVKLDDKGRTALASLKQDGVAVIPDFFTAEQCTDFIDVYNSIHLDSSITKSNDKRIFGIQHLSALHKQLFTNEHFFQDVAEAYLGEEVILQTTMAAKITATEDAEYGSGGCWHRDSFSRQFKAVVYLNDVTLEGGPFQYIKGSHKLGSIFKVLFNLNRKGEPNNSRYNQAEITKIENICNQKATPLLADRGTLILVDIRGIHTGKLITKGSRYSIFNYYIAKSWQQEGNEIELMDNNNIKGNQ